MMSMMKMPNDLLAGQFLVIKDEFGSEKVVIIGNNNHFIFDSLNEKEQTTPLVLKKYHKPKILGNFVQFVKNNSLKVCLKHLDNYLNQNYPDKKQDSLFIVRSLYWLLSHNLHHCPNYKDLDEAVNEAIKQESQTIYLHHFLAEVSNLST